MTLRSAPAICLIGLTAILVACSTPAASGSESEAAAPTPTELEATTEATASPDPSESAGLDLCSAGEMCTGQLEPGEYTTDALAGMTLSFSVEEPWLGEELPEAETIALYETEPSRNDIAAFKFSGEVFPDPCDIESTESVDANPEAMVEWLTTHPELEVGEPEEATLGEATGLRVQVTASKDKMCPEGQPIPPDWILLWQLPAVGDFHFNDGQEAVVYALQVGEELVIVLAESVEEPDVFLPLAQPVIDSMRFAED